METTLNAYALGQILEAVEDGEMAADRAEYLPARQRAEANRIADRLLSAIWPQGIGEE